MKILPLTLVACALFLTSAAHAQWQSVDYTLRGGWNAIYLHGDATHDTISTLFSQGEATNVLEIWRWNPNPDQTQFTSSPLVPSGSAPEWSVWARDGSSNTLDNAGGLPGQFAYLVKCAGPSTQLHSFTLMQRPLPPSSLWVRNGANLLGFPTRRDASPVSPATPFPKFDKYFATFPAALAANSGVYKYVGGDLGAVNPLLVFSPAGEQLDRNQAYWFESEVVGNFYAPIQITLSQSAGLDFGRNGSVITATLYNRSANAIALTIAPVDSVSPPALQETIQAAVPLTRRVFNAGTATWTESVIAPAGYTETIPGKGTVTLSFGIDRTSMGGGLNAYFASLLRFTDEETKLFDILLPVQARKTSLAGLWVGDAFVTKVESKPQADNITPTGRGYPLRYLLHVDDAGTARLLSQVFIGPQAAGTHAFGLCTQEAGLDPAQKADSTRLVSAHLPLDLVLDGVPGADDPGDVGSGSVAIPGELIRTVTIPFDDVTNPFVHQYHPDHDNKSASGGALVAGQESYAIERKITFTFTATPPPGSTVNSGWGSSVIGGTYAEVIQGLHKDSVGVGTGDGLRVEGTFELRRASELGTLTITP